MTRQTCVGWAHRSTTVALARRWLSQRAGKSTSESVANVVEFLIVAVVSGGVGKVFLSTDLSMLWATVAGALSVVIEPWISCSRHFGSYGLWDARCCERGRWARR
jgi:hypothetical protein